MFLPDRSFKHYSQMAITCSKLTMEKTGRRCEVRSKLTMKILERRHWPRSTFFIISFEHISHLVLVFLLLTLSRQMLAGIIISYAVFSISLWYHAWFWREYAVEIPKQINSCYDILETMCHANTKCKEISNSCQYFEKMNYCSLHLSTRTNSVINQMFLQAKTKKAPYLLSSFSGRF